MVSRCFIRKTEATIRTAGLTGYSKLTKGLGDVLSMNQETNMVTTTGATQLSDIHYCLEEGMYFEVDGKKINPQWFFLATKYSEKGYLWKNDVRVSVKYGDEMSGVREKNSTVFHAIRWMWRFCGRDSRMCSDSNPVGVTQFSVIY